MHISKRAMSNLTVIGEKKQQDDNDGNGDREKASKRITISISAKTHDDLDSIGVRGETFDQIIQKCIQAYKKQRGERAE